MRFALAFAALVASVVASPSATPTTPSNAAALLTRAGYQRINPPVKPAERSLNENFAGSRRASHHDTNAKRLAAGLPLKAPTRRFSGNRPHAPRQSSSPCTNGVVHITYGATDAYLSSELNPYGEYYTTTTSACDASALQICAYVGTSSPLSITLLNPDDVNAPYFGGVVGFASDSGSLSTTSSNYIVLAGTAQSSSAVGNTDNTYSDTLGEGYEEPAESDIWLVAEDGTMTLSWTNEDDSQQVASVGYSTQEAFVATADPTDFTTSYGEFDVAVLTFIPSSSVSCSVSPP